MRLSRVGIVAKERNRGASVRQFTADELRQIYELREILQRKAALRIKLPADPNAIARLKRLNEDYERAVEAGDFHLIHETNDRFHTELFGLCNNPLLVSLINLYMEMTYAVRGAAFAAPENLDKSRGHHRIMIQLLSGADSWALAQICVDHIPAHEGPVPRRAASKNLSSSGPHDSTPSCRDEGESSRSSMAKQQCSSLSSRPLPVDQKATSSPG